MTFPDWVSATERSIINGVIKRVLAEGEGFTISVYDGEEFALKHSRDPAAIRAECAATDETTFVIRDNTTKVGTILFIHGNDEDVLSDYSWSEYYPGSDALMEKLCNV